MKEKFKLPERAIRLWFWLFAALCLIAAIAMPDRGQMVEGMLRLCTLPYQSANSYFDASGGGFAGTRQLSAPSVQPSTRFPAASRTAFRCWRFS